MKIWPVAVLQFCHLLASANPDARLFQGEMLRAHNCWRSQYDAAPLVWSDAAAANAQAWATRCRLEHQAERAFGENLFWTTSMADWSQAVDAWAMEEAQYDYGLQTFSEATGHFTQVVWKGTQAVGCGQASCAAGGTLVVCEYSPPGNVNTTSAFASNVGKRNCHKQ